MNLFGISLIKTKVLNRIKKKKRYYQTRYRELGDLKNPMIKYIIIHLFNNQKYVVVGFLNKGDVWIQIKEFPYTEETKDYAKTCANELLEYLNNEI